MIPSCHRITDAVLPELHNSASLFSSVINAVKRMLQNAVSNSSRLDSLVGETGEGCNTLSLTSYIRAVVTSSTEAVPIYNWSSLGKPDVPESICVCSRAKRLFFRWETKYFHHNCFFAQCPLCLIYNCCTSISSSSSFSSFTWCVALVLALKLNAKNGQPSLCLKKIQKRCSCLTFHLDRCLQQFLISLIPSIQVLIYTTSLNIFS